MAESWNDGVKGEQFLPLINTDAPTIRVEAGPGTGKTFGLVRRVERIVHPDGLAANGRDVLVVAFNRVIAKQLADDIHARLKTLKDETDEPVIRTIHALCVQVIGEELRLLLPHEREAMIYDLLQAFPVLKEEYKRAKKADQALRDHEARHADHVELWQAAGRWLERHKAHLIGDVPGLLLDRLAGGDFPDQSYDYVVVDEFQDLTPGEQELMFRLRSSGGQLVALGDPRQSIYKFRGNDREGLSKLGVLASTYGDGTILDTPMNECQRCPVEVVSAANRLMSLSEAHAMAPVSEVTANLHLVTWADPHVEANGMAEAICANFSAHPCDRHLVMVTRRKFGYWLRDRIAVNDPSLLVELNFSEGLLETWVVREAFLFFCLRVDPDHPTWRAWFAYRNSETGETKDYKPPKRNADAYLKLLGAAADQISDETIEALAAESRTKGRGSGGSIVWDRAQRYLELREELSGAHVDDPAAYLHAMFDSDRWIDEEKCKDVETARLDMQLLLDKALGLLAEVDESQHKKKLSGIERLRLVARRLRYQIATREPFATDKSPHIQVATMWGAKGITAEHVYLVGVCDEAIPGSRRDEYPGTDEEYLEEQRRLFYVSMITRSRKTLVLSRATSAATAEAMKMGLAIQPGYGCRFNRSVQQCPRVYPPASDSRVFCEVWCSGVSQSHRGTSGCSQTGPSAWGSTVAASRWCSRWSRAATDSAGHRSTLAPRKVRLIGRPLKRPLDSRS